MANLDKEKIQAFRDEIDGEKLAEMIQNLSEERVEKAFRNKDIQKLADKLGEDMDLFQAVMGVYDTEKSYAAATAAVPGDYTKEEFDEFRTVYANLFLKDFQEKVNGELVGNLSNLVNRTLTFVMRPFSGQTDSFLSAMKRVPEELPE